MRRRHLTSCLGFTAGVILAAAGTEGFSAGGPTALDTTPRTLSAPTVDIEARDGPPQRAVPRERALSGNPLWAIPLSSLSVTRERPIFRSSRRAPAPAVAGRPSVVETRAAPPQEATPPQLALVGAVVGETDGIAIFLDQANSGEVVRLRMGEEYDGWVLHALKGREAILRKDGENLVLALPAPDSMAAPAAAPTLQGSVNSRPAAPPATAAASPATPSPLPGPSGAMVYPPRPGDFAPFVPRSTPKNGEHDGL